MWMLLSVYFLIAVFIFIVLMAGSQRNAIIENMRVSLLWGLLFGIFLSLKLGSLVGKVLDFFLLKK